MSNWDNCNCHANILNILADAPVTEVGPMWMTGYQIAIRFEASFPDDAAAIGLPVGGAGAGPNGLAQYLSSELANRIIRRRTIFDIEVSYLDLRDVRALEFNASGQPLAAGALSNRTVALFRRRPASDD